MGENPLGKATDFPQGRDPELLHGESREDARSSIGIGAALPFHGEDIWNAWELTWLDMAGKPQVATAVLRVPAQSPNIIESKSLKLYLNSHSMTHYAAADDVVSVLIGDLSDIAGYDVAVSLDLDPVNGEIDCLPGQCIDALEVAGEFSNVDASVLKMESGDAADYELHSHLLRSNCPVTNQPDSGSILVRYRGNRIDPASLLRYLISYRQHNDFHEACVERIFVDVKEQCGPDQLTVYARYNRRGGIDINPFRSDFENSVDNLRLKRQ